MLHSVRTLDMGLETSDVTDSLSQLFPADLPVFSLETALTPIVARNPNLCPPNGSMYQLAKRHAPKARAQHQNLTLEESVAITLYSLEAVPRENSLYHMMNKDLRTKDPKCVEPWRDYVWLLLHSLKKLPLPKTTTVFRGSKNAPCDLGFDLELGSKLTMSAFSSTAATVDVMKTFLGQEGPRTLMNIEMIEPVGRDITAFSVYPRENEILLPPNVSIEVVAHFDCGNGLTQVQCKQSKTRNALLDMSVDGTGWAQAATEINTVDWLCDLADIDVGTRVLGSGGAGPLTEGVWRSEAVAVRRLTLNLSELRVRSLELKESGVWKELQLLATSQHANIVPLRCAAHDGSRVVCLATELHPGSLADWLALYGQRGLPTRLTAECARGIFQGLAFLHGNHVVHQHLTPSNVLVSRNGCAKLCDIGTLFTGHTNPKASLYQAPEMKEESAEQSGTGDVFSAGVILLELIVGEPPRLARALRNEGGSLVHVPEVERRAEHLEMIDTTCDVLFLLSETIKSCIADTPAARPLAAAVPETLNDVVDKLSVYHCAMCDRPDVLVAPTTAEKPGPAQKTMGIHRAAELGLVPAVRSLLEHGCATVHDVGRDSGSTPLHCAAEFGHVGTVRHLVEVQGTSVGVVTSTGATPLHIACAQGHSAVAAYLVGRGAPASARDSLGRTALEMARARGHSDIVALLQPW